MKWLSGSLILSCAFLAANPAVAASYTGKLDLVQTVSSGTIRFVATAPGLNLLVSGDAKEILLQAFYRKATVSVIYNPTTPCGYTGSCGTPVVVTVYSTGF